MYKNIKGIGQEIFLPPQKGRGWEKWSEANEKGDTESQITGL